VDRTLHVDADPHVTDDRPAEVFHHVREADMVEASRGLVSEGASEEADERLERDEIDAHGRIVELLLQRPEERSHLLIGEIPRPKGGPPLGAPVRTSRL
jgi:hypothetical protein